MQERQRFDIMDFVLSVLFVFGVMFIIYILIVLWAILR